MAAPKILERFRRRYLLGLTTILLLATGGQAVIQWSLSASQKDSNAINLAGCQRMLSQRVAKSILLIERGPATEGEAVELATAIAEWKSAHGRLRGNATQPSVLNLSPALATEFAGLQPVFDRLVQAAEQVQAAGATGDSAGAAEFLAGEREFLVQMDRIVALADAEAAARVTRVRWIEGALWLATLAALVLEARYVFRPFAGRLKSALTENEMLEIAARNLPSMVIVTDARGRIEWVNPAFIARTGYALAEIAGRRPGEVLQGPETDPATVALMRANVAAGKSFSVEILNYTKAGAKYWQSLDCRAVCDEVGAVRRFVGVQVDTTERVDLTRELSARVAQWETLVRGLPGVVYDYTEGPGAKRAIKFFSPGLEELYDLDPAAAEANPELMFAGVEPEDRAEAHCLKEESARTFGVFNHTRRIRRRDGTVRWVNARSAPQKMADGAMRWTGILTDESQRAWDGIERRKLAGHLHVALRAARFGIWRENLLTGEREWDERVYEIFGLAAGTPPPAAEKVVAMAHEEDRAGLSDFFERLAMGAADLEVEFRLVWPDGTVHHTRALGLVLTSVDGKPEWVSGLLADITVSVEAERRRRELERQLLEGQRMETLGTLAGGVAHDFNNLLTAIGGFVELARFDVPAASPAQKALSEALRAGGMARDLVKRLLLFARRVPGAEPLPVDVAALVRDSLSLLGANFTRTVSLKFETEEDVPPVLADAGRIQQLVMNLAVNAAQAIGGRPGTMVLGVGRAEVTMETGGWAVGRPPPGTYVRLAVSDTGAGMTEAVRRRIFEPFFTTKPAGEGTGLGLAIVQTIVLEIGGGLRVESEPGVGTRFEVFLPLVQPPSAPG